MIQDLQDPTKKNEDPGSLGSHDEKNIGSKIHRIQDPQDLKKEENIKDINL